MLGDWMMKKPSRRDICVRLSFFCAVRRYVVAKTLAIPEFKHANLFSLITRNCVGTLFFV
jgi:hypothetical protein